MSETNQLTKKEKAIIYTLAIIAPLCKFPEEVKIDDLVDERGLTLNITANEKDLPLLIGRGGLIVNSIRNLLHIWGVNNIAKVSIFINPKSK